MSFAGWFRELPSGMSHRLWEQGGHERQPGEVALYTVEADAIRDELVAALERYLAYDEFIFQNMEHAPEFQQRAAPARAALARAKGQA